MPNRKYGRKPVRRLMSMPSLGDFVDRATTWPAVPPQGWEFAVKPDAWGMLGNDQYGNCLTGDAIVDAPDATVGYRAPYDGPVLTFNTKSGKRLTVTPNHPMLTERGYVPAHSVKYGDNLVSTRGTQILPRSGGGTCKRNVNYSPSPICEVFSTFNVSGDSTNKMAPMAVHFHGDGQFINGNIEIVASNGLLGCKSNSSLCEPYTQNEIGSTRKLEGRFHSSRSSLQSLFAGWRTALSSMRSMNYPHSLCFSHASIAQPQLLPVSAKWNLRQGNRSLQADSVDPVFFAKELYRFASRVFFDGLSQVDFLIPHLSKKLHSGDLGTHRDTGLHKSASHGIATSAKDFSDFLRRFSGLVHLDRVVNVEAHSFAGHVFNLSTDEGWYSANGIVTHNCAEAGICHLIQGQSANTGNPLHATTEQALALYSAVTGFNPNDPSTDQGTVLTDLLTWIKDNGVEMTDATGKTITVEIVGSASLDITSPAQIRYAAYTFGGNYLGINCPQQCETDTTNWNFAPGLPIAGGHCIPQEGEGGAGGQIISWGMKIPVSNQFLTGYLEEGYCLITKSWLNQQGKSPTGLDLDALVSAMKGL